MPKHPPKKKQKIEQPEKDQNQNNESLMVVDSNKNNVNYFQSLFLYDWFLIELGRKLINNENENDLINILCLNRKINDKAIIVFRQHFLNFDLQKEIFKLVKLKEFKKVEQLFQTMPLSLNPNILISIISSKQSVNRFLNDPKIAKYLNIWHFGSGNHKQIHLAALLSRNQELESFAKSLLFHPRLSFKKFPQPSLCELANWSVVKGYVDIFRLILERSQSLYFLEDVQNSSDQSEKLMEFDPNFVFDRRKVMQTRFSPHLDWNFLFVAMVTYSRFEMLKFAYDFLTSGGHENLSLADLPYFELCSTVENGFKYYELILDFQVRAVDHFGDGVEEFWELVWMNLSDSVESRIEYDVEYTQCISRLVLDTSKNSYCFDQQDEISLEDLIDEDSLKKVMQKLLKASNSNKESWKIALKFAFSLGFENEFKLLLNERKWIDRDLLDLFHTRLFSSSESKRGLDISLKLILEQLNPSTPFPENDFESLLTSLNVTQNDDLFQLIWSDKRTIRTKKWTNEFVLKRSAHLSQTLLQFLIPQCSLSEQINFNFMGKTITKEFRDAYVLRMVNSGKIGSLNFMIPLLGFEWTTELAELAFQVQHFTKVRLDSENICSLCAR